MSGSSQALFALLQLSDSAFPSGTFTHSFGLEQLARQGILRTPAQVEAFVASVLTQSIATADAVSTRRAMHAAALRDLDGVIAADRALFRTKAAAELRAGSLATGRRFVEEAVLHLNDAFLIDYARRLRQEPGLGMQPVAFGVVAGSLGVSPDDCVSALLFGAANAVLQAAMRLLPFSHRDAQAILHRLRPRIDALVQDSASLDTPRAFHPLQEVASMRHASAEARLFAS